MSLAEFNVSEGVILFTDGSAYTKDRSGGWAWIAIDADGTEIQDSGADSNTTNNRMEMRAWIEGLETLHQAFGACQVIVFSDSEVVGLGAMDRTRKRNKNRDLWYALDWSVDLHSYVEFCHVRGHTGNKYNERVDKLAGQARKGKLPTPSSQDIDPGCAEPYDPSLYANARERVYGYLCSHMNQWVTRDELRQVGGDEAIRRVRELRDEFSYPIQMKHLGHSRYVYRILEHT